ncbi:MAG TPA: acyltransferase family protein [Flexivirga sp.]|uniref:acyltransferase family protein n=1 Tax=Flexivirga sp. TaxID=1962927 RepID=UPI002CD35691|nr:acyltransferase family protein [Flexivirga sp.]HWC21954.1 acyltransferase family protein [Flexivirga sp.]
MSPRPTGGGYRPALDGLRAISVLTILAYHVPLSWAKGGYWGVNTFFVVSGYLITGLLLREYDNWRSIDLVAFYVRRARRLLPALLLMSVSVSLVVPRVLGDQTPSTIRGDGLASLFYVANWRYIATGQSYFAQFGEAATSPFKHTWSLAIEEQYYLLFPLLLLGLLRLFGRRAKSRALVVVMLLAVASATLMALLSNPGGDPSRAYYGTDTRMQDVFVGAALAIAVSAVPAQRVRRWAARNRSVLIGLGWVCLGVVLVWCGTVPVSGWVFYGGYLAFDIVAAGLVLAVELVPSGSVARVLGWKPLAWAGMISYGLYLWHYPIFVVLTEQRTHLPAIPLQLLRFGLTFGIAALSYYLIENPIRNGALRRLGRPAARVAPVAAVTAAAVIIAVSVNGMRLAPTAQAGSSTVLTGAGSGKYRLLIVGDSVGFSLGYNFPAKAFPTVKPTANVNFGCGTAEQHIVVDGQAQPEQQGCGDIFTEWSDGVTSTKPNVIVWSLGAWEVYDHEIGGKTLKVGSAAYASYLRGRLEDGLTAMNRAGAHGPIVIPEVPCLGQPKYVVDGVNMATDRNDPKRAAAVNQILKGFAAAHRKTVHLVNTNELVCPTGKFTEKVHGVQLRHDGVHYTKAGASAFWRWIMPQVAGWVPGTPKAKP